MQQAIDILDEMIGQNRYGGTTDYSIDAEKWLIEARSRIQILGDGWIPVSERLPEEFREVLTYGPDGMCVDSYENPNHRTYKNGFHRMSDTTHWKPLDLPPKQ